MQNAALKLVPVDDVPEKLELDILDLEIPTQPKGVSSKDATIFSLTSVSGGSGVTSISIQMAYHIARRIPSARIGLISLDFENNALPYYLDVPPVTNIENFCQRSDALEAEQCHDWMSQTPFGFDILPIPTRLSGNHRVNPDTVIHFLDLMARHYDYLILDIPRIWTPWTQASLGASDKLGMVSELNIPNLHLTREKCSALIKKIDQLASIEIILNKIEKRAFGNSVKLSDASKAFLTMPIHSIPATRTEAREALNRGEPLAVAYEDIKIVKAIGQMTDIWLAETQQLTSEHVQFA